MGCHIAQDILRFNLGGVYRGVRCEVRVLSKAVGGGVEGSFGRVSIFFMGCIIASSGPVSLFQEHNV